MKKIITISREFGAGGSAIGMEVAKRLNYEFFDKALILHSAKELGIDVESMFKYDEKVPANFGFAQSLFEFYNRPLNEKLFEVQQKVIHHIGEKGNCVVLGRNANSILKEFDHSLHVFVHAPYYWRLEHMKEKMPDMSEAKLSEQIKSIDKARKKYCSYYTDTEFGEAYYYDISLNSGTLGIEKCIDIICDLAQE